MAPQRIAEGDECEQLWRQMVEISGPNVAYQEATDRQIPVVVLDPV